MLYFDFFYFEYAYYSFVFIEFYQNWKNSISTEWYTKKYMEIKLKTEILQKTIMIL